MRAAGTALLLAVVAAGCEGASNDPGLTSFLRLSGGQFVPGALDPRAGTSDAGSPAPTADGGVKPAVVSGINLQTSTVAPGQQNLPLSGDVENGTSVLIGLAGDSGHWIVPSPTADFLLADNYIFQTKVSLSPLTPPGPQALLFRGVALDGQVGPALQVNLNVAAAVPTGALVISLTWDANADLDLHVLAPNASDPAAPIEIWSKAPVGLPPRIPGDPPLGGADLAAAQAAAGKLDIDSNANCVIDGRRQENVVFMQGPPPGTYVVRVDTFSLCGQPAAQWQATAALGDGTPAGAARWESVDADTRGSHGAGAGRTAFSFTIY